MSITTKQKNERLAELKNEVKEFHPLLHDLLQHLPRVTRHEYTHDQFEKGADFILFRMDDALCDIEYVGVIAKTGKIVSDISKIREQIRECTLHRYVANGRKSIRLDEVWVITNEHISNAAQEKIHNEFAASKIKFLQHAEIVDWIDKYLPSFWKVESLPVAKYLDAVVQAIAKDNAASSLVIRSAKEADLDLGFLPIETKYRTKGYKAKPQKLVDLVLKHKVLYLEGEAGSGKTRSIRNTITRMCSSDFHKTHKLVPFLIGYPDFYRIHGLSIEHLMQSDAFKAVAELLDESVQVAIFIDGIDELVLRDRNIREELKTIFDSVARCDKARIILTTRPLNLGDYDEILPEKSAAYEIERMSIKQVMHMLKTACESAKISERLWGDIQESDLFKQLPRNPISTLLLAQIINDNQHDLPSNLTDVYSRYIEIMLGGWDIQKGLQSRQEYEFSLSILGDIAEYFINNDLACIGEAEALNFFQNYLGQRNTQIGAEELYKRCLSRSGIVLLDHAQRFCFKHRSFAEFLYALKRFGEHDRAFVDGRIYNVSWRTIYFFYVGLNKDCSQLLSNMMAIKPKNTNERFWRFVNIGEYLLAGYKTPYRIVEDFLPQLFREANGLYMDIIGNRIKSPLSDMPEIFVLHFFQAVSSSCYAYRYFAKALENCVVDILQDRILSREEQAYAVFFISTVFRALKLPNPFDGLLEDFDKDLPFQIRLGVFYNTKDVVAHSTLLNRNEKWVKHEMKKNPELRRYAKKLHEIPVGGKKEL
jgi:hypothetical protein